MNTLDDDRKHEKEISARADARRFGTDQQKSMTDKDMAKADSENFSKIKNDDVKRFAGTEIASNMRDFPGYKKELDSVAPGVSSEASKYEQKNSEISASKESRKQNDAQAMEQQSKAKARSEQLNSKMASQMGKAKTAKENTATASETEKPKLQASK